jgi:hypothetical protein
VFVGCRLDQYIRLSINDKRGRVAQYDAIASSGRGSLKAVSDGAGSYLFVVLTV